MSVDPSEDQHWTRYGAGMLLFSVASMLFTYLGLRLQHVLPLNPQNLPAVPDRQAFETAASFTTNTNWQSYSGESMMSYDLVHVADLLRGLRPLLTAEAARRDVELTWDIEPGLPRVPGDRNRLLEAIELLLRHLVGHADAGAPIRIDATKTPAGVAIAVHHGPIRTAVALKLAR